MSTSIWIYWYIIINASPIYGGLLFNRGNSLTRGRGKFFEVEEDPAGKAGNIIPIVYHTSLDADENSKACFQHSIPQVLEFPAVSFGGSIPYPHYYLSNEQLAD